VASKDTSATPPAVRATAPEAVSTVDKLIRAYERADYVATFDAARQWTDAARLINDIRAAGDLWPASPHREAVLALELAQAGLFGDSGDGKQAAEQWLAEEGRFLRPPLGPDGFEHDWLAAELALLEAIGNPASVQPFVASALQRFPDDPGFLLANAIVSDQRWPLGNENVMTAAQAAKQVAGVTASYDAVIAHPEAPDAVAEARVREAYFFHRLNRDAEALSQLDAVRDPDADPAVRFLRDLFRGHVLIALGRTAEAVDAYRAAVAILPGAQSARVALMNALVASGDRPGALALSESIQATPASDADPWHLYWPGDYRRFPQELGRLRALVR
jgi:tetratricopeptide (TPR) repeat protein